MWLSHNTSGALAFCVVKHVCTILKVTGIKIGKEMCLKNEEYLSCLCHPAIIHFICSSNLQAYCKKSSAFALTKSFLFSFPLEFFRTSSCFFYACMVAVSSYFSSQYDYCRHALWEPFTHKIMFLSILILDNPSTAPMPSWTALRLFKVTMDIPFSPLLVTIC